MAQYEQDKQWYKAKVVKVNIREQRYTVAFVEYDNEEATVGWDQLIGYVLITSFSISPN